MCAVCVGAGGGVSCSTWAIAASVAIERAQLAERRGTLGGIGVGELLRELLALRLVGGGELALDAAADVARLELRRGLLFVVRLAVERDRVERLEARLVLR